MNTLEHTKNVIARAFKHRTSNTLLGHLKTYVLLRFINYSGEIKDHEFWIWRSSFWGGWLYPIIHGKIVDEPHSSRVILRHKPNPLTWIMSSVAVGLLDYVLTDMLTHFDISVWKAVIFILFIIGMPFFTHYLIYRYLVQSEIKVMREYLEENGIAALTI